MGGEGPLDFHEDDISTQINCKWHGYPQDLAPTEEPGLAGANEGEGNQLRCEERDMWSGVVVVICRDSRE